MQGVARHCAGMYTITMTMIVTHASRRDNMQRKDLVSTTGSCGHVAGQQWDADLDAAQQQLYFRCVVREQLLGTGKGC